MTAGDRDEAFEDEEYRREMERERAERRAQHAPPTIGGIVINTSEAVPVNRVVVAAVMACRQCGAEMLRGTQCGRCGAWCR